MKKLFAAAALLLATVAQAQAPAAEPNWEVRFRAVQINFAEKSSAAALPKDTVFLAKKVVPEVDISYYVNPYLAAELILTYPQRLDVYAKGLGKIGTVDALPPVLTIQGHYPMGPVNPYVGVGANLTLITAQRIANKAYEVDSSSVGFAAQAGFDLQLPLGVILNADVKWFQLSTAAKVKADGTKLATLHADPLLIGVGVAYKF